VDIAPLVGDAFFAAGTFLAVAFWRILCGSGEVKICIVYEPYLMADDLDIRGEDRRQAEQGI
jgi:hypothetical protein